MTDAELAEIRATVKKAHTWYDYWNDSRLLLAEVDRLQTLATQGETEFHARILAEAEVEVLQAENDRLKAIISTVRRCYACHAEVLNGRVVADEDWREEGE